MIVVGLIDRRADSSPTNFFVGPLQRSSQVVNVERDNTLDRDSHRWPVSVNGDDHIAHANGNDRVDLASELAVGPNVDSTLGPTEGVSDYLREAGVRQTAAAFVEARKPRLACRNTYFLHSISFILLFFLRHKLRLLMPYILRALSSLHSANRAIIVAEQEVVHIKVPLFMNFDKVGKRDADYTLLIALPSFQREVENLRGFFLRQSVRQAELLQVIAEQLAIYFVFHGRFSATVHGRVFLLSGGETAFINRYLYCTAKYFYLQYMA